MARARVRAECQGLGRGVQILCHGPHKMDTGPWPATLKSVEHLSVHKIDEYGLLSQESTSSYIAHLIVLAKMNKARWEETRPYLDQMGHVGCYLCDPFESIQRASPLITMIHLADASYHWVCTIIIFSGAHHLLWYWYYSQLASCIR